jgi:hypothetical protein
MTALEFWLTQATRHLAREASAQVRAEIQEHHEAARDAFLVGGASAEEADRLAVNALGDARAANRQYRRVLLTHAEAKSLREGSREANALCSHPGLKWLVVSVPFAVTAAATALFFTGHAALAQDLFIAAMGVSPLVAALLLPINTPARGLIFRCAKWITMTGAIALLYGPNTLKWSWLLLSCLGSVVSIEVTRASIRRKLPVKAWPRHLYF